MIYPYKCNKCDCEFEIRMTIKQMENSKVFCEACKSDDVKRVYTPLTRIGERYKANGGNGDGKSH